jgi:hypothetical protein
VGPKTDLLQIAGRPTKQSKCCDRPYASEHIITLLIAEREQLNRAIEALQGPAKRRGRPPKNQLANTAATPPAKKGRRTFTAAQRKVQAAKMKAYWTKRKKEAK